MQSDNSFIKKPLKKKQNTKASDWKLYIYAFLILFSVIIFNFVPPVRDSILKFGEYIDSWSWIGPLLLIGFLGCIVIPFGLPYLIFESALALLYGSFIFPFTIAVISKFIGTSISFWIARSCLKQKFESWLNQDKIFESVQKLINESPWKFSCLFRIIMMPYMIKNYGLALSSNMNYFIYITTALFAGAFVSGLNINFAQQTRGISEGFFNDTPVGWYNVIILLLTILSLFYIVWYTVRMIKKLNHEEKIGLTGISIELDATVGDDSNSLDQEAREIGKY